MNCRFKFILLITLFFLGFNSSKAASSVTARMDSVNLLMGKLTTLYLEIVQNQNEKGHLTIFENPERNSEYIGICGDSVELRTTYKADTVNLGSDKIQINYQIPMQAFDSGTYRLPEFVFVIGKDSAFSNHLTFNVIPVNVTANDPIAGFARIAEPEGKRFYDWIPDWILDFWWIFLIIALAICAFLYGLRNYKKEGKILPVSKPLPSPYEEAINKLNELKAKKLWEQGLEKEYYTQLTDILRNYLERRFGINAMEMTSRQIMERLYESDVKDKRDYIRQILRVADFVKFAKVRPLPADSIESFENAVKFVEETKPVEQVPKASITEEDTKKGGGDKQ